MVHTYPTILMSKFCRFNKIMQSSLATFFGSYFFFYPIYIKFTWKAGVDFNDFLPTTFTAK